MTKVVIIGAGSAFGSRLSVDILSREPLRDSTIALCDIDRTKLDRVGAYVRKVIEGNDLPARVETSTERRDLLRDADFVVLAVAIGGPAYFDHPYDTEMGIPAKYGLVQTVGDTVNVGGVFRTLRSAPEILRMADDVAELAPRATILNYTNPMAMLTWLIEERCGLPTVGLCHSVQGTSKALAGYIGAPYEEVGYTVAGINHMAWFLEFTRNGEDALPTLREAAKDPEIRAKDPIRFEVMDHFGAFVTESSRHMCEYLPYYQHEPERMEPFRQITAGTKAKRASWFADMGVKIEDAESIQLVRSHEYASGIMEAMVTGVPMRFNGNVPNRGLIQNLPEGCCVEVPCFTDAQGIHPQGMGRLPTRLAALCRTNVHVQELAVEAVRRRDLEAAYHAVLLDPATGGALSLSRARAMFDELVEAEGELLAEYHGARESVAVG